MPLHTPKTLQTWKKSTPCLIKKAARCVADHTSKTSKVFYLPLSIKYKDLCICDFMGSVMKIVSYLHFLYRGQETSKD